MFKFLLISVFTVLGVGAKPRSLLLELDERIVGGKPINIDQVPYQISLQFYDSHICGGSIIASTKILSAAHCTDGSTANQFRVRHSTTIKGSGGVVIKVDSIAQHPDYNPKTYNNDVSVLTLTEPVIESNLAKPVPLADSSAAEGGRKGIASGWGRLSNEGASTNHLQAVTLDEVDRKQCNAIYGGTVTKGMICFATPSKDTCRGDSGGPLVSNGVQIGIISFGRSCASPFFPGIYANVAFYRDYIDSN